MPINTTTSLIVSGIVSGLAYSLIGIAYQWGKRTRSTPEEIAMTFTLLGTVVFTFMGFIPSSIFNGATPWSQAPLHVVIGGLVSGCIAGSTVLLIEPARQRGPFSPIWCAMNLTFLPTALFSLFALGESLALLQWGGLIGAILCILISAFTVTPEPAEAASENIFRSTRDSIIYVSLLISMVLLNGITGIVMKMLDHRHLAGTLTELTAFQMPFLAGTYAGVFLACLIGVLRKKPPLETTWKATIRLSLLAALGSMTGFFLLCRATALPGGMGFALSSIASFVATAIYGAVFFHERRNAAWYITLILGIISVVLFNT